MIEDSLINWLMTIYLAFPKVNYVEIGVSDSGSLIRSISNAPRLILCISFALEY